MIPHPWALSKRGIRMRSNREWPAHRGVRCQGRLEAQQFVLDVAHQDRPRCASVLNDRVDRLGNSLALTRATGSGGSNQLPRSGNADLRKSNIVLDPDMQTTSLPSSTNSSVGVLCCIGVFVVGFSDSTSIWPPSSREECVINVVGYALHGQGDAHPPCPQGCWGGIEESESGVPLRWRLLCCAPTVNRETRTDSERPEGPSPSKPLPSFRCHGIAILEEPPPYAAFESHVLRPPPAQFQYAAKTGG